MIKVNLLPEDKRPVEHTPYPRLITILLGVVLIIGGVFWALILGKQASDMGTKNDAQKATNATLTNQRDKTEDYPNRKKEIVTLYTKMKSLYDKYEERFLFSPKLDTLYKHDDETAFFPPEIFVKTMKYAGKASRQKGGQYISLTLKIYDDEVRPSEKVLDEFLTKIRRLGLDEKGNKKYLPVPTSENVGDKSWDFITNDSAETFKKIDKDEPPYTTVRGRLTVLSEEKKK